MASRKTTNSTPKEDPRLSRIRENQRRSRARRRQYLEDLEGRWKKCQELGVQANIELQRAARKVIEENRLLRVLLAELGFGAPEVDKRLRVLRETTVVDGGGVVLSTGGGDGGCCGDFLTHENNPNRDCYETVDSGKLFQPIQTPLESTEKSDRSIPSESAEIDLSQTDIDLPPVEVTTSSLLSGEQTPAFYMSQLEPIREYDNTFNISDFLEPLDSPLSPTEANFVSNQETSHRPFLDSVTLNSPTLSIPTPVLPHNDSAVCESILTNTTHCMDAYALLKALNAQRKEHKDMFEIMLELWSGACYPGSGGGTDCRVDNEVLQRVIDGMKRL